MSKQINCQIHVGDFLRGALYASGPAQALKALLIIYASQDEGMIPNDPLRMAQVLRYDVADLNGLWPDATADFEEATERPGYLLHPATASYLAFVESQRERGNKSAAARAARKEGGAHENA